MSRPKQPSFDSTFDRISFWERGWESGLGWAGWRLESWVGLTLGWLGGLGWLGVGLGQGWGWRAGLGAGLTWAVGGWAGRPGWAGWDGLGELAGTAARLAWGGLGLAKQDVRCHGIQFLFILS